MPMNIKQVRILMVLSWHLPGETKENHNTPQLG